MNNRLDFISEFTNQDEAINEMKACRNRYIELDGRLRETADEVPSNPEACRCIAIARSHIETALQYSIKALCLKWEKKDG